MYNFHCRIFRLLTFLLVLAGGLWLCTGVSLANSPAPANSIVISPENVPEEAEYLELLIPMPKDDPYYRSFNQPAADETGLTENAPIVRYMDEDGYVSYSFHMESAVSSMRLERDGSGNRDFMPLSFGNGAYAGSRTHLEYIQQNFGTVKAALLDREGNVLTVSEAASIRPGRSGYLTGTITFDCAEGRLSPGIYKGNVGIAGALAALFVLFLAVLVGRAIFTGAVEAMVSLFFQIRAWRMVFLVNVVSNSVFNLLLLIGTAVFQMPYLLLVIVGEVIVVRAEYLVFRKRLLSCERSRILAFTVTANLASLLSGIAINYVSSNMGLYWLGRLM